MNDYELSDPKSRGILILDDEEPKSVDDVISKVSKKLKDFTFEKNKRDPRIVHVIDNDLRKVSGYAIDQKMDLKYSGVLADLSRAIQNKLPTLAPRAGGSLTKLFDDHVTRVDIDAKNESVRSILTNWVPVDDYSFLLWRAETKLSKNNHSAIVQYYGPAP